MFKNLAFLFLFSTFCFLLHAQQQVVFSARDSVKVFCDEYFASKKAPIILLCHDRGCSRGEYAGTVEKIRALGYNCIAFDHRDGDSCNGVVNQTRINALKGTSGSDGESDIEDALFYFNHKYGKKLIVMGSGYAASVILKLAKKDNSKIKALICYSPVESLGSYSLEKELKGLSTLTLIYCSKDEETSVARFTSGLLSRKTFHPTFSEGEKGARVLWPTGASSFEFWNDLQAQLTFLKKI